MVQMKEPSVNQTGNGGKTSFDTRGIQVPGPGLATSTMADRLALIHFTRFAYAPCRGIHHRFLIWLQPNTVCLISLKSKP